MTTIYQGAGVTEYHLNSGQILTLNEQEYQELLENEITEIEDLEKVIEHEQDVIEKLEERVDYLTDWIEDES